MQIKTLFLGTLEFSDEAVICFPQGILGLPRLKRFILCEGDDLAPFRYLVSLETPEIAFLLIHPQEIIRSYEVEIHEEAKESLLFQENHRLVYYVIVTPSPEVEKTTVNLMAPLVIDAESMRGCQVIQEQNNYPVKYVLFQAETQPSS
jgi:flagellar assembly factor FliW